MPSVWSMILPWGSTIKVSIELPRRNQTLSWYDWKIVESEVKHFVFQVACHRLLSHESIIKFYGFRKDGKIQYIFLEYASGGELFDRIGLLVDAFNWATAQPICVFEHSVMTSFNCACPDIQRSQGSGFLLEASSWVTACLSEQWRFWRVCPDAQACLNLRCSHRHWVPDSLDTAQLSHVMSSRAW